MSISGITATDDNDVLRVTTSNDCDGATVDGETLVLGAAASRLRATTAAGLVLSRTQVKIGNGAPDGTGGQDNNSVLTYGIRGETTNRVALTEDTSILIDNRSARLNLFVSELSDSEIIESQNTQQTFVYTQQDAILRDCVFRGIRVWEVYRTPSLAANISVQNADYGYLNWEAGRLDFLGFAVSNIATAHAWLGGGNGGFNQSYHWNNDPSFDNEQIYLQSGNSEYFEGFSISWEFTDRDSQTPVEDVLVVYGSDFDGAMSERGRYVTDVSGHLTGTYDSQFDSVATDESRPTLFVLSAKSNQGGSDHSAGGGNSYSIDSIQNEIEVRSYLHEPPSGASAGDSQPVSQVGSLNPDYSVDEYATFTLVPDSSIVLSKSAALALTEISNSSEMYDRAKAEWRDNDNYPVLGLSGTTIDFGAYDVVLDAGASQVYSMAGNTITVKCSSTFTGSILTTGDVTIQDSLTAIVGDVSAANISIGDGVDFTGSTLTGVVSLSAGRNLSNVTVVGGMTFNDDTSGTFSMDGCTIDVLANDGTGVLTFEQANSTVSDSSDPEIVFASPPTPSSFSLVATSDDAWAYFDDTDSLVATGTGSLLVNHLGGIDEGLWTIVIKRKGFAAEIVNWQSDDGSTNTYTASPTEILRPEGGSSYSGGSTTGILVSRNADDLVETQIPNRLVSPQEVVDAIHDFLQTQDGLEFIKETGVVSVPNWGALNGITFFLNITGFQFDSISGVTPESAVGGVLVSSAVDANVLTANGGTTFVSVGSVDTNEIATAVWAALTADNDDAGSFGEFVQNITGSGGGGSGDATAAQQVAILDAIGELNDLSASDVLDQVNSALEAYDGSLNVEINPLTSVSGSNEFYDRAESTAQRLIAEYGNHVILRKETQTGSAYSPEYLINDTPVLALDLDVSLGDSIGSQNENASRTLLVSTSAGVAPERHDRIFISNSTNLGSEGGEWHTVLEVRPLQPNGQTIFFEVDLED